MTLKTNRGGYLDVVARCITCGTPTTDKSRGLHRCCECVNADELQITIDRSLTGNTLAPLQSDDGDFSDDGFNWQTWAKKYVKKHGRRTFLVTDEGK